MTEYLIPHLKNLRNQVVLKHYNKGEYKGMFMLSCGNAYRSMVECAGGVTVVGLSTSAPFPEGKALEDRFYSKEEVESMYPGWFNATPGMLDDEVMEELGGAYLEVLRGLGYSDEPLMVPVGSGETIVSLSSRMPKESLIGFTTENYPPIRLDYSHLADRLLNGYTLVFLREIGEARRMAKDENVSIVVTWL